MIGFARLLSATLLFFSTYYSASSFSDEIKLDSVSKMSSSPSQVSSRLDIGDALNKTWQNHPLLTAAEAELLASAGEVKAAKVGYLPFLEIDSRLSDEDNDGRTTVSVTQPIYLTNLVGRQVDEAEAGRQAAFAAYRQAQLDLSFSVNEAFAQVNASQDRIDAWQNYYDRLKDLLATIKRRVKEGRAARVDIDSVNIRVTQAEAGLAISQSQLFEAKSQLTTLMFDEVPELSWPDDSLIIRDYASLCVATDCLSEQHPLLFSASAEFNRQKAIRRQLSASLVPTLELTYEKPFSHDGDELDERVRLDVSYRSDNGLRSYRSAKAGLSRLLAAETRLTSARRDIALDLLATRSRQQATRVQFGAQSRSVKASQDQVDSFIRQYKAGKKTWLEVLNAEREVHQSKLSLIDIKAAFWVSNIRLILQSMDWYSLMDKEQIIAYLPDNRPVSLDTDTLDTQ